MKNPKQLFYIGLTLLFYACEPNASQKAKRLKEHNDTIAKAISAKAQKLVDSIRSAQIVLEQLKNELQNVNAKLDGEKDKMNMIKQYEKGRTVVMREQQVENQSKVIQQLEEEALNLQVKIASLANNK